MCFSPFAGTPEELLQAGEKSIVAALQFADSLDQLRVSGVSATSRPPTPAAPWGFETAQLMAPR